ncbi:hypothetical protein KCU65_g6699, partial [Aureobasidium melanogenum]
MKFLIHGCPRKDADLTATGIMTVTVEIGRNTTEEQVICKQSEPIKYFYLLAGKYTKPLLARSEQLVMAKYPELFRELEGDDAWDADEKSDQYGRYDKAPWFYRRICLHRMFRQWMAEMKNYPHSPKRKAAETLISPSQKQRKSRKIAQAVLPKNHHVEVYDATDTERNIHQVKLTALVSNQTPAFPGKETLDLQKLSLKIIGKNLGKRALSNTVTTCVGSLLESMWEDSDDPHKINFKLFYEKGPIARGADNAADWGSL